MSPPHRGQPLSASEQARIADLLGLVPPGRSSVLDVGARDGRISRLLTSHCASVTALDLHDPPSDIPRVRAVAADACDLPFPDDSFDLALCAEVLEHLRPERLAKACAELARVARLEVLIGVPYRQDVRAGRTTCASCGKRNPPWGHLNSFDEERLNSLFLALRPVRTSFVGLALSSTNAVSAFLMDLAGDPSGTYHQQEVCVYCGRRLVAPRPGTLQKLLSRAALTLQSLQHSVASPAPAWIHVLYRKGEYGG